MRGKVTIKQCEDALRACGGFVTHAAKMLGISSSTLSYRVSTSERLQRVVAETKAEHLDLAESTLLKKIKAEDLGAICFYLKCQGKERGYIERWQGEISGRDGGPIKVQPPTKIEVVLVDPTKSDAES
jgi:hypothetical protein